MNNDEIPGRGRPDATRNRFESAQGGPELVDRRATEREGFGTVSKWGESVAIFQLDVPEKFLTQLKKDRHAVFLTALALGDHETIIQVEILVLNSKEFVYTETAIKDAGNEADSRAITVPWVERK